MQPMSDEEYKDTKNYTDNELPVSTGIREGSQGLILGGYITRSQSVSEFNLSDLKTNLSSEEMTYGNFFIKYTKAYLGSEYGEYTYVVLTSICRHKSRE